ncbi:MAG: tetratricopeptide repeat protein, partial [Candidatus Eremiobacteraeota bacterium]|nr:tetratricopeptide repeat protein [Candidatus Eremiobacteraeota bacterium]
MRTSRKYSLLIAGLFGFALTTQTPVFAQDATVATAIADRDRGDYLGATHLLQLAAARHPEDADLLRLLGTTLAFAKHYGESIQVLRHALALSPRDADIGLALCRALLWSGRVKEANVVAAQVAAYDPKNSELGEVQRDIAAAYREAPRIGIGLSETGSRVRIGTIDRNWFETDATISVPIRSRMTIVAGVDVEDRQTSTDTQLTLRADSHIGKGFMYLGGTATPSATFREHWSLLAGSVYPVLRRIDVSIDLRHAHYTGVDVTVV